MKQIKLVLLGSGGVGKTSMSSQFVREVYEERYEPTIEEIHNKTIVLDGAHCDVELVDTAGVDQLTQMRDVYIREGHGFILVYSLVDRSTFEDVQIIREQIVRSKCSENVPIVLVGNKLDLAERDREVQFQTAEELAARWPHCIFLETSAKSLEDVQEVFSKAVRQVINFESTRKDRIVALHREASKRKKSMKKCLIM